MSDGQTDLTCRQAVFADDDCCTEEVCEAPATWMHAASGSTLCDEHEANARKWSSGGVWRVGSLEVSYPDGWERVAASAPAEPALQRIDVGPGLVVEREPLSR